MLCKDLLELFSWLKRVFSAKPPDTLLQLNCSVGAAREYVVTQPSLKTFTVGSILIYEGEQGTDHYDEMRKTLDAFVPKWASYKLNVDVQIDSVGAVLYRDFVKIDPEKRYGIDLLYKTLDQFYPQKDLWLVYAPFYTPRTKDLWGGFYDWGKMVFNTFVDNNTNKDETYVISEEMLHALLDKLGYSYQVSVEKVHSNRGMGLADFFDKEGNFMKSGHTSDYPQDDSTFMTVGGDYPEKFNN